MSTKVRTHNTEGTGETTGGQDLNGCFSVACATIKWNVQAASNYGTAIVTVYLNNDAIGSFEFTSNLQNWPVPMSAVGNCELQSAMIQGQASTPSQIGNLSIVSLQLQQGTQHVEIQNQLLESWTSTGFVTANNSNC